MLHFVFNWIFLANIVVEIDALKSEVFVRELSSEHKKGKKYKIKFKNITYKWLYCSTIFNYYF